MLLKTLYQLKKMFRNFLAQKITVTTMLHIKTPGDKVYQFFNDPIQWPLFELHGIRTISFNRGLWEFESYRGPGYLLMEGNPVTSVISYAILFEHEDMYEVSISILNQGNESISLISITKPDKMPVEYFENRLRELDTSLVSMRLFLESKEV